MGDFNFIPTAVASSGLDVTFTSSDSLVAQVQSDGRTLKIRAAGSATITANQAGDAAYNAATAVTQTLTVGYFNLQDDSFPGIRLWLDGNNIDGDDTSVKTVVPSQTVPPSSNGSTSRATPTTPVRQLRPIVRLTVQRVSMAKL